MIRNSFSFAFGLKQKLSRPISAMSTIVVVRKYEMNEIAVIRRSSLKKSILSLSLLPVVCSALDNVNFVVFDLVNKPVCQINSPAPVT